ncbi:MAG: methyltransferase domain-containing protein [Myxococcota bacterium]
MDERVDLPPPVDRVAPITERLLDDAGIEPSMRVLDVGCGRADVTLMLARRVGASGRVIGLDRSQEALSIARARTAELGLTNVEFVEGDLASTASDDEGAYDAIVGRRVLMYQPDRVAAMRALSRRLRPDGLVVFEEIDTTMVPAPKGSHPLHERVYRWVWTAVEREGATTTMGLELPGLLEAAGFEIEGLRAEAVVQTASRQHITAQIVKLMVPRMVAAGVIKSEDVDVETLPQRLTEELQRADRPFIGDVVFGAWARKTA